MEHTTEVKNLLQQTVDSLCKSRYYEEEAMCIAQRIGLQGEKRRMRYDSVKCTNLIHHLLCDAYDAYGITIEMKETHVSTPTITNFSGYFNTVLGFYESKYDTLHGIANKLVLANAKSYAEKLYCICGCVMDDIRYFRRTIAEGKLNNWDASWILLHETTDHNVHDHMEEKEKGVGYNFE